jgi:hypothetical protein
VRGASRVEFVRALQRTIGNAATVALLARKPAGAPAGANAERRRGILDRR